MAVKLEIGPGRPPKMTPILFSNHFFPGSPDHVRVPQGQEGWGRRLFNREGPSAA